MRPEQDNKNREVLASLSHKFHLDDDSEGIFQEAIFRKSETDPLSQMLGLGPDQRLWFDTDLSTMSKDSIEFQRFYFDTYNALRHLFNSEDHDPPNQSLFQAYKDGYITDEKGQKRKLFRFLQQKGVLTHEQVVTHAAARKSIKPLRFCLSRNPIDLLMSSSGQSFSSCMDLMSRHSQACYMGLPLWIADPNRIIAFLSTGEEKYYDLDECEVLNNYDPEELYAIAYYRYLERTYLTATAKGFHYGKSYPRGSYQEALLQETQKHLPLLNPDYQGIDRVTRNFMKSLYPIPDLRHCDNNNSACCGFLDDLGLSSNSYALPTLHAIRWVIGIKGGAAGLPAYHSDGFKNIPDYVEDMLRPKYVCNACDAAISEDEYYTGEDDNYYCQECYYERFTTCSDCGCTIWNEAATSIGDENYCEICRDRNATRCCNCEEWIFDSDVEELDGECYCTFCYSDLASTCDACDGTYHEDDVRRPHDSSNYNLQAWCKDCRRNAEVCAVCGGWTSEDHPCGCAESESDDEEEPEPEPEPERFLNLDPAPAPAMTEFQHNQGPEVIAALSKELRALFLPNFKFAINDPIVVTNPGNVYTMYQEMADSMGLTGFVYMRDTEAGAKGYVVAFSPHPNTHIPLYGVRLEDGYEYVIGEAGVARAAETEIEIPNQSEVAA